MEDVNPTLQCMEAQINTFKVAALQMVSGPNIPANLSEARRLIEKAVAQGAQLVVLPEFFSIIGLHESEKVAAREQEGNGVTQTFLSEMACKHRIWIVGGSIPLVANTPVKVRNACLVFDEHGKQVARYDKIHLYNFDLGTEHYHEGETLEAGNQVVVVDSPFGRIGLAICYDLRFPELFRAMKDVDIIVLPSAFTATTGKLHWEILVRARAIENLTYVIATDQGGYHANGRVTNGHSMIVDPWGQILDELQPGPGVALAEVNHTYLAGLRSSLPALSNRILT